MQTSSSPGAATAVDPPWPGRPPLVRPIEGGLLAGVCAGLSRHLRLHLTAVRAGVVLAVLAGGVGLVAYAFLWIVVPEEPVAGEETPRSVARVRVRRLLQARRRRTPTLLLLLGLAVLLVGLALAAQRLGPDLRLDLILPLVLTVGGVLVGWSLLDDTTRERWVPSHGPDRRAVLTRLIAGAALTTAGLVILTAQGRGFADLWNGAVAAAVVLAGVVVVIAPLGLRLWRALQDEQAERVRVTERADVAAHLHDSVLQTLALIQRRADDPAVVTRLARRQERELRSWLYGRAGEAPDTLAAAVRAVVEEVEETHGLVVEPVVTGDMPMDEPGTALVGAVREALHNAARHGRPPVSAYIEVGPRAVEAFVRDHGTGFDPDAVPTDRLGVRESIVGRMRRVGGWAEVRTRDPGTEVVLTLPRGDGDAAGEPRHTGSEHD